MPAAAVYGDTQLPASDVLDDQDATTRAVEAHPALSPTTQSQFRQYSHSRQYAYPLCVDSTTLLYALLPLPGACSAFPVRVPPALHPLTPCASEHMLAAAMFLKTFEMPACSQLAYCEVRQAALPR